MAIRATQSGISANALNHYRENYAQLLNIQRQLATGLRFERASDAPVDAARIQSLENTLSQLRSDQAQISPVRRTLNQSVSTLLEVQDVANRAKQIAFDSIQQNDESAYEVSANEVQGLITQLEQLVHTQIDDQFLFSGTAVHNSPVKIAEFDGLPIPFVQYGGSEFQQDVRISASISIATRYSGSSLFFSQSRQTSLYIGSTGAAAGTGTDSGVGRAFLDVTHVQTTYSGASGVQPGADSVSGDTIVGPAGSHQLTIVDTSGTGAAGTVSLNGGTEVSFSSADGNLQVTGPAGEVVFVDTTSIAAGFNGTVGIESTANISTDGGQTQTLIDFSSNQTIRNDITGQLTNVDTSNIRVTGRDHIEYRGSADLFTALHELKDDLLNSRGLSDHNRSEALTRRAEDLERALEPILQTVGRQSIDLQNLETLDQRNANQELELQINVSDIASVDLAEAATALQTRQLLIQSNFAALSIVQNLSVLDFLG